MATRWVYTKSYFTPLRPYARLFYPMPDLPRCHGPDLKRLAPHVMRASVGMMYAMFKEMFDKLTTAKKVSVLRLKTRNKTRQIAQVMK